MPYDELITLPDGTRAFVRFSGKRPRPKPCAHCGAQATLQCDYPVPGRGTCDAHLCRACGVPAGRNRDYCPTHKQGEMKL